MKICGLMKTTLLDYPGHVACTVFTGGCNLRCPVCHNKDLLSMDVQSEYSKEEIFEFLKKRQHTLEGVAVTGGEPTLQKDLPDFLRKIKDSFGLKIKLDTNGTNPQLVRELMDEGLLSYIAMDIKAGEENYCKAAGVDTDCFGSHMSRIRETIALLMENRVPFEFRTTVVDGIHSEEDFRSIGKLIEGAPLYALQCYKDSENVLRGDAGFKEPSPEALKRYRNIAAPFVKKCIIRGVDIEI